MATEVNNRFKDLQEIKKSVEELQEIGSTQKNAFTQIKDEFTKNLSSIDFFRKWFELKVGKIKINNEMAEFISRTEANIKKIRDTKLQDYYLEQVKLLLETPVSAFKSERDLVSILNHKLTKHSLILDLKSLSDVALERLIKAHPKDSYKLHAFMQLKERKKATSKLVFTLYLQFSKLSQEWVDEQIAKICTPGGAIDLFLSLDKEAGARVLIEAYEQLTDTYKIE